MGFNIATNIDAMMAEKNLQANSLAFSKSVQELSSGLRINSAADDAAGLAISDKLGAQVNGLNQAASNSQDGISMLQTADGAASQITAMIQRVRELAVQAANDTLSTSDRQAIGDEMTQLQTQMSAIATQTQFNGKNLLDGSLSTSLAAASPIQAGFVVAAGTNTSVTSLDVSQAKSSDTYTFSSGGAGSLTLTNAEGVAQTITVNAIGANGTESLDFSQLGVNLTLSSVSGETAANVITGLTGASKTITTGAGSSSANIQDGANASNFMTLAFSNMDINSSGSAGGGYSLYGLGTAIGTFTGSTTSANAQALITAADSALNYVDTQRANYGAYQNRLQYTINNLNTTSQNLSASEAQIKDANVASVMVQFTNEQILQQAGTAVLAQANQAPQTVLKLLG